MLEVEGHDRDLGAFHEVGQHLPLGQGLGHARFSSVSLSSCRRCSVARRSVTSWPTFTIAGDAALGVGQRAHDALDEHAGAVLADVPAHVGRLALLAGRRAVPLSGTPAARSSGVKVMS